MKFAYADPPYFGCGHRYREHHVDADDWDFIETHVKLIDRLTNDYEDGWALSCSSPSLGRMLFECPEGCRVAAWVKPFAVFKPNVNPAYAWEPVIFWGGRKGDRSRATVRDWLSKEITLQKGLVGAKPAAFCEWILDLLGFDHTQDTLDDLFPGTGIMGQVISGRKCIVENMELFA
jgi:hypothetical protein